MLCKKSTKCATIQVILHFLLFQTWHSWSSPSRMVIELLPPLQLDFLHPLRFNLFYVAEDERKRETPVIIHRAILGSSEHILGILIEHYKKKLPFWLSPRQVIVCSVSEKSQSYALQVIYLILLFYKTIKSIYVSFNSCLGMIIHICQSLCIDSYNSSKTYWDSHSKCCMSYYSYNRRGGEYR